jgi:hypothetical protein
MNLNIFKYIFISSLFIYLGIGATVAHAMVTEPHKNNTNNNETVVDTPVEEVPTLFNYVDIKQVLPGPKYPPSMFKHGDISWLPELAAEAGWPADTWDKLGFIILRESGGCPYRKGGDKVDKYCNITGHDGSNHASDTGLLQINGVHWKKDHPHYFGSVCEGMGVCDQWKLMDPVTNLKAGKLLYDRAGWAPWDVCSWNPTAKGCKKKDK